MYVQSIEGGNDLVRTDMYLLYMHCIYGFSSFFLSFCICSLPINNSFRTNTVSSGMENRVESKLSLETIAKRLTAAHIPHQITCAKLGNGQIDTASSHEIYGEEGMFHCMVEQNETTWFHYLSEQRDEDVC